MKINNNITNFIGLCLMIFLNTSTTTAEEIESIKIHGFISQGYLQSYENNVITDSKSGTFQFNEMGINFSTDLSRRLHIGMQFFSRDLGDMGNDEIDLDWASADYRWKDYMGFIAGKNKIRNGLYSETRDVDMLNTFIFLPNCLYHESSRTTFTSLHGLGVYGHLRSDKFGRMNYLVQYGGKNVKLNNGFIKYFTRFGDRELTDTDMKYILNAGIKWNSPVDGLLFSGTLVSFDMLSHGKTLSHPLWLWLGGSGGQNITQNLENLGIFTLSCQYTWKDLIIASEWLNFNGYIKTVIDSSGICTESKIDSIGYYISLIYSFTDIFEAGLYYSIFYQDENIKDGANLQTFGDIMRSFGQVGFHDYNAWQKDIALTTRFNISENWTIKLEGHFIDGTAFLFLHENPEGMEKRSFLFACKITFSF